MVWPKLTLALGALQLLGSVQAGTEKYLIKPNQVRREYDYIIVGGGTSGLTVADRLTESGKCMSPADPYPRPASDIWFN